MTAYPDLEKKHRQATIGRFLKNARELAGLTQAEVARELKYTSAQFISNWERGLSQPPMDVLPTLAELYDINPKKLIDAIMAYQEKLLDVRRKHLQDVFRKAKSS